MDDIHEDTSSHNNMDLYQVVWACLERHKGFFFFCGGGGGGGGGG